MTSQEVWVRSCLGKKKYSTLHFAEKVVKNIKNERGIELYIYSCPTCFGFHLTKQKETPKGFLETMV